MRGLRILMCVCAGIGLAACTANEDRPVTNRADAGEIAALKGLSAIQVKDMLGPPSFTRRDKPAEIWQYRNDLCILDLFLYPDAKNQTVAHYAVRSPRHASDNACLESFQVAAKGQ